MFWVDLDPECFKHRDISNQQKFAFLKSYIHGSKILHTVKARQQIINLEGVSTLTHYVYYHNGAAVAQEKERAAEPHVASDGLIGVYVCDKEKNCIACK